MKEHHARIIIRAYGILLWIIGLLLLEAAFGLLVVNIGEIAGMVGLTAQTFRVILVIAALVLVTLGFGVQLHKRWARVGAIVLSWFLIAAGTYLIVQCEDHVCSSWVVGTPLNIIRILVGVFGLWFFTYEHVVEKVFKPTGQPQQAVKKK